MTSSKNPGHEPKSRTTQVLGIAWAARERARVVCRLSVTHTAGSSHLSVGISLHDGSDFLLGSTCPHCTPETCECAGACCEWGRTSAPWAVDIPFGSPAPQASWIASSPRQRLLHPGIAEPAGPDDRVSFVEHIHERRTDREIRRLLVNDPDSAPSERSGRGTAHFYAFLRALHRTHGRQITLLPAEAMLPGEPGATPLPIVECVPAGTRCSLGEILRKAVHHLRGQLKASRRWHQGQAQDSSNGSPVRHIHDLMCQALRARPHPFEVGRHERTSFRREFRRRLLRGPLGERLCGHAGWDRSHVMQAIAEELFGVRPELHLHHLNTPDGQSRWTVRNEPPGLTDRQFDAFFAALTAYLYLRGLTTPPPKSVPEIVQEGWVHVPDRGGRPEKRFVEDAREGR